jgi:hypothetical protein
MRAVESEEEDGHEADDEQKRLARQPVHQATPATSAFSARWSAQWAKIESTAIRP